MALSTWVIGSYPDLPETDITVVANAVSEVVTIPAGSYYLTDPSNSLSLCKQFELALEDHSEISSATVSVCRDRIIRVTANVAFSATFADTTARSIMGFTSMGSSSSAHTAQGISSYLWSPNRLESTPLAPHATHGRYVYDTSVGASAAGRVVATTNNFYRENRFVWNHVLIDRVWTEGESAGEYFHFFHNVLRKFPKIKVYREVTDDVSSTSAATFSSPLGPYIMKSEREVGWELRREIANVEYLNTIDLSVHGTPEYDN